MRALALLALIPLTMWVAQSVLLWHAGMPLRWRLSGRDLPRHLKRANRAASYVAFAAVLLGYPLSLGFRPWEYYRAFFPLGARPRELGVGLAAAILYLALLYVAWCASGQVRFEIRHSAARLLRRLSWVPMAAVLIALLEELLFRAVLLKSLLVTQPAALALAIGVVVFAGAHYVRSVKRYWTFAGHLALGTLFCLAFYWTGALWLSLGLHAGGIVVLSAVRPFIRYVGPPWLIGASIFPYAGVVGVTALLLLTLNIGLKYG
jgi:membrane protease YdiL (CAAX protease family)